MNFFDFLSKNWSQIAVVIAAFGYLLKVVLDYKIKKREIKFQYLYAEKAKAFKDFSKGYENANAQFTQLAFRYGVKLISFSDFESTVNSMKEELKDKLDSLKIYCSSKEQDGLYSILNDFTFDMYKVKNLNENEMKEVLLNNTAKARAILNNINKDFRV